MKRNLLLIILMILFFPIKNQAQWQLLDGPSGVNTTTLVQFQNIWFAGTSTGLIESTDQGQNWTRTNEAFNTYSLSYLSADNGKMIFKKTYHLHAYLTTDSGATWTTITPDSAFPIVDIKISGNKIYAHCSYNAFHISSDDGATWNHVTLPTSNNLEVMEIYQGRLYCAFSNNGSGQGGLFYSDDDGLTWTPSSTNGMNLSGTYQVASLFRNYNQVYLLTYDGLYKSTDTGNNWTSFTTGLPSATFANPTLPKMTVAGDKIYVYVNLRNGLFVSDTSAASFTNQSSNLPFECMGSQIVEVGDTVYAPMNGGIFKASKNDFNWQFFENGVSPFFYSALTSSGSSLYAGSSDGFSVSTDNGVTFNSMISGLDTRSIFKNSGEVTACSAYGYRTTNNGNTWNDINFPYGYYAQQLIDYCSNSGGMIGMNIDGTLKSSSNGGVNWNTLTFPAGTPMTLGASNSSFFIATISDLYRSPVLGGMWTQVLSGQQISKILYDSGKLYAINNTGGSIWYSTNDGVTWNDMHYPSSTFQSATVYNNVLVTTPYLDMTTDFGTTWTTVPIPLPNNLYPELVSLNNDYLFISHADSIYRLPASLITDITNPAVENQFSIYPIPSTNELFISTNSSTSQELKIQICDMQGKILIQQSISEQEKCRIDLTNLPTGILLLRLESVHGIEYRKFVHL